MAFNLLTVVILTFSWIPATLSQPQTTTGTATQATVTPAICTNTCNPPQTLNPESCLCVGATSTTPAPTNPAPILCGSKVITGFFNDATLSFEIRTPFYGNMFFYINGFDVTSIKAYNKLYPNWMLFETPTSGISHMAILALPENSDIIIEVDGIGKGQQFNALSHCVSLPPTAHPTQNPSTARPTSTPTTLQPTNHPVTPSPTQPGEMQCNLAVSGEFNGQQMIFNVLIPYKGDITFNIEGPEITLIRAYDTNNPTMKLAQTSDVVTNELTVSDLSAFADVTFIVDGNGKATFNAIARCDSPTPTSNPTTPTPTYAPAITCGDPTIWGEVANEPIYIEVIMPYDGELVFDASSSFGFDISKIIVYDTNDLSVTLQQSSSIQPDKITISELRANTKLMFKLEGTGNGMAVLSTSCTSNAPTLVPTTTPILNEPTSNPTATPIEEALGIPVLIPVIPCPGILVRDSVSNDCVCPTKTADGLWLPVCTPPFKQNPTTCDCEAPSSAPTISPSDQPTAYTAFPTMTPSVSPTAPTTARPTHMSHILCGDPPISGMLSDPQQIYFDVRIPFKGDITVRVTSSFRAAITGITAYDGADPALPIIGTSETGDLTITNLRRNADITFRIHGSGNGLYIASTECKTSAPAPSPTVSPVSPWPTYMTSNPTSSPTNYPTTAKPTGHPTTAIPTRYPTTPSPTHPGLIRCGFPVFGDFNDQELVFGVSMPYNGDLTFVIRGINIISIKAYSALNPSAILAMSGLQQLTVPDVAAHTNIMFVVDGMGKGPFNALLDCVSPSPTKSPTFKPTLNPTTALPTRIPTMSPTLRPTNNPTTPSPTHPGRVECGTTTFGDFNGGQINFNVIIPWDGDITLYITGVNVMDIRAFGGANPTEIISRTPIAGINSLTVFNLRANTEILFHIDGTGKSRYNVMIYCNPAQPHLVIDGRATTKEPTQNPIFLPIPNVVEPMPITPAPTTPAPTTPAPTTSAPTTSVPTRYPTTPYPTTPPAMQCGVVQEGDFNQQQMVFHINIPFKGDLTFFISGFTVTTISAYNFLYPTTLLSQTPMVGINSLAVHDLAANTDIVFKVDGVGKNRFSAITQCTPATEVINANITNTASAPLKLLQCDATATDPSDTTGVVGQEHNIHHILLSCCGATISNLANAVKESGEFTAADLNAFGHERVYAVVLSQAIIVVEKVNCDASMVDREEIIRNAIVEVKELMVTDNITEPPLDPDIVSSEGDKDKKDGSGAIVAIVLVLLFLFICNITIMWCYFRKKKLERLRTTSM